MQHRRFGGTRADDSLGKTKLPSPNNFSKLFSRRLAAASAFWQDANASQSATPTYPPSPIAFKISDKEGDGEGAQGERPQKMAASRKKIPTMPRQSPNFRFCADRKRSPQKRKLVGWPTYHGLPPAATNRRHLRRENPNHKTNIDSIFRSAKLISAPSRDEFQHQPDLKPNTE